MLIKLLIYSFFFQNQLPPKDSIVNFQSAVANNIYLYINMPPEYYVGDSCFHYTELLKVEIGKAYKIISIEFSDSAPNWLKTEMDRKNKKKNVQAEKLDSLAKKANLSNCTLVFPVVLESEKFPCGEEKSKRRLAPNYFQFGGNFLKTNKIIFGEQMRMTWPNIKTK